MDYLQLLINSVEDYAIYMLDQSGHVQTWNHGAQVNKGYTAEEIVGKHLRTFFTPEDVAAGVPEEEIATALSTGRKAGEGWRIRKNGERFWASFVLTPMYKSGEPIGFAKVVRDLTQPKRQQDEVVAMQEALTLERDRLKGAAESSLDAFYICEAVRNSAGSIEDFTFNYLNRNVENMVSLPRDQMLGRKMCDLLPVNRTLGLFDRYKLVVLSGEPLVYEFPIEDKDVHCAWIRVQAVKLGDGVAITASDITQRKRQEFELAHMANHDALTGLPNRNLFHDRLEMGLARASRLQQKLALMMIDLNDFKLINDQRGHHVGDALLKLVATRLQESVRASDTVARFGGDEFVILLENLNAVEESEQIAAKVREHLCAEGSLGGFRLRPSASLGVACFPDHAQTSDALMRNADAAMYRIKAQGRKQNKSRSKASGPAALLQCA